MSKKVVSINAKKAFNSRSKGGDFLLNTPSNLYLMDGTKFTGKSPGWQKNSIYGEVVFNTGMTGYVESLTDPSYSNQILVFTYPMIGNYGVQFNDAESDKIQVSGVVVSELALNGNHTKSDSSLLKWLASQKIPVITGADTRAITKHLRSRGAMIGSISPRPVKFRNVSLSTKFVSIPKPITYNRRYDKKIILVDCGMKDNILRSLLKLHLQVKRVPYNYDYSSESYDGLVLTNGPGDPTDYPATIEMVRKALGKNKPIFGICLGTQIMGLAAGAKTYKLLYGHRGHNQPCIDEINKHCYITSQNHGYAIAEKSLPKGWRVSFRNLNDDSVEGIEHTSKPFFSVQFHPEASPGPTDTEWLFDRFYKLL